METPHPDKQRQDIQIDLSSWSINLQERKRDRMKLQIKLNKIEAQAYKNFAEVVKPDEISDADFLKSVFKIGLEEMENRLMTAVEEHAEKNNIDLEKLRKDAEYDTTREMVADTAKVLYEDENESDTKEQD